jgi:hypothetical protein
MDQHDMTATGYIGGPDSLWHGARRPVPKCKKFPCPVITTDDGLLACLAGPDEPVPRGCLGAAPAPLVAAPVGRRRPRDADDEGEADTDYDLGDALARITRRTLDLSKTSRAVKNGSLSWIADFVMFQPPPAGEATGNCFDIMQNLCVYDVIISARVIALVLLRARAAPNDIRADVDPADPDNDFCWQEIAGPAALALRLSPLEALTFALTRLIASLGRRARAHRTRRKLTVHKVGDSEVQIRDPKGQGLWLDWLTFLIQEESEDAVDLIDKSVTEGPVILTLEQAALEDTDFIIGCFIIEAAMDRERSCRPTWRALDARETAARKRLSALYADDMKAFKTAKKASTTAASAAASASATVAAISAATMAAAGGAPPPSPSTQSFNHGGAGRGGRGAQGGRGHQPARGTPPAPLRSLAQVKAAPPGNRSGKECLRYNLCLKCRDSDSHRSQACTGQQVQYVP